MRRTVATALACLLLIALLPLPGRAQIVQRLISTALETHPQALSQRALVQSAAAGVDGARWQFYPTPSVSVEAAGASASDRLYQGDHRVSTLRLQQPLWTGGRLTAGVDRAEAGLAASQAGLDDVRQQLALRVVQSYGDWLAAHLKTLVSEKSLATHQRLRDQVGRRVDQGVSAQSDATLAQARLESIGAELAAGRAQRDLALVRLGQLLGRPLAGEQQGRPSVQVLGTELSAAIGDRLGAYGGQLLLTPARGPQPGVLPVQDVPPASRSNPAAHTADAAAELLLAQALAVSPSLQKAQAQARVQAALIGERRADYSPDVYLRAERQYGNYNFPGAAPENRLFIGMTSRLGAGLSTRSNVEAAIAQHESALAEVDAQARSVAEQVLADLAVAQTLDGRLASQRSALAAATAVAESYDRQFLAGRKSWLDVMNAARELAQTETQIADLQATQVVLGWRLAITTRGVAVATESRP